MPAYLYSLPAGIPGMISRDTPTVEPQLLDSSNQPTTFGVPVVIDATSHKLRAVIAADTADAVIGFNVRPYPFSSSDNSFGAGTPPTSGLVSVMRRGYMSVKNNAGTPVNGGTVYVRIDTPAGAKVVGGIEASSDTTHSVALTNAFFTGAADADGNVEIAYNI